MNRTYLSRLSMFALALGMLLSSAALPALAQEEGEPRVVEEVIAQVNSEVITLSMLRREMRELVTNLQQRGMSEQQANEEVARRQPEIIANLIHEQLLVQKGRELGFEQEVEAEVNRRMLAVAREQNIRTLEELERAMRASNLDPAQIRQTLRTEIMKEMVLGREVDAKIYFGLSSEEVRRFFDANRERFRRSESVTLSEIYLSFAGRNEEEVRARAAQIVAQARAAGADFGALAVTHSDRTDQAGVRVAPQTRGVLGRIQIRDITVPAVANALRNVPAGGVSDPIRMDEGYLILRVETREAAAEPTFEENRVREAMTTERLGPARLNYLRELRADAYVRVAASYRDAVMPFLNTTPAAPPASATTQQRPNTPAANQPAPAVNRPPQNNAAPGGNRRP